MKIKYLKPKVTLSLVFVFAQLIIVSSVQALSLSKVEHINRYYNGTSQCQGEELFYKLQKIISNRHFAQSYRSLYDEVAMAFKDKEGNIVDFYSRRPYGNSPYHYKQSDKCGNYRKEGDCYNREHIFPQGVFGKRRPMKSDFHHIIPTDGYVNNRRGSYPFGEVGSVKWSSLNGSKLGSSKNSSYKGVVFEPLDEYKGDIARALFYFAVRYQSVSKSWRHATLDKNSYLFYTKWYIKTLKKWHKQDPVSELEIKKNDRGEKYQYNRNPFIDHPEWVDLIW